MTGAENTNRTLGELLWGGVIELKARQPKPPAPEPKKRDPRKLPSRPPLLRYPQGEAPLDRGICRMER
jgi:hypothetical protein